MPNDADIFDLMLEWVPDADTRKQNMSDNAASFAFTETFHFGHRVAGILIRLRDIFSSSEPALQREPNSAAHPLIQKCPSNVSSQFESQMEIALR